jgi:hypothetical protein
MKTLTVLPTSPPPLDDVASLVESAPGGYWRRHSSTAEGGVDGPQGAAFVSYDPQFGQHWQDILEESEQSRILAALGHEPSVAIHVHLSSAGDSETVAQELVSRMLARWGGICLV